MMNFYGMFWVKSNLMIYTIQNLYLCWKMMQITIVFIIKFVIFILFITAFFCWGIFFDRDCKCKDENEVFFILFKKLIPRFAPL